MLLDHAVRILISFGLISVLGCSSSPKPRSVWADKSMRACVASEGVSPQDSVAITTALVKSGKFMVIDRSQGLRSVVQEQNMLHRNQVDRFDDREKYARYGKLFGCGSVVVAHSQCFKKKPIFSWSNQPYVNICQQYLSMVDTNSAEIIVAVDGKSEVPAGASNWGSESFTAPSDWEQTVADLVEAYPKNFQPKFYSEGMEQYRDIVEEESLRQKEVIIKNQERGVVRTPASPGYDQRRDLELMKEAVQQQNANGQ